MKDLYLEKLVDQFREKLYKGKAEHQDKFEDMPASECLENAVEETMDNFAYMMTAIKNIKKGKAEINKLIEKYNK